MEKVKELFKELLSIVGSIILCWIIETICIMILWNVFMPEVCGFSEIGFWQAFCLGLLGSLVSKSNNSELADKINEIEEEMKELEEDDEE